MTHAASPSSVTSAAHASAALLVRRGVRRVFVYAAPSIEPLLHVLRANTDIELIHMRSATTVAFAASGYARATGEVAVCLIGGGPAATSVLTGVFGAQMDSVPMLVLAGQVETTRIGTDAWQETDTIGMTASVTKHNFQPRTGSQLCAMIDAALTIATTGRPGVVFVDMPRDTLNQPADDAAMPSLLRGYRRPPAPTAKDITAFYDILDDAKRPLMILGGGTVPNDAAARVVDLAEALNVPVATTMAAKGAISETHPHALGLIGTIGRRGAIWAYEHCDLIIAVGCRFADRMTGEEQSFLGKRKLIHIDVDPVELGKSQPLSVGIQGDCSEVTEALLAHLPEDGNFARFQPWLNQCATAAGFCHRCVPHPDDGGLNPKRVMDMINQRRRSDEIVVAGVGEHQAYAAHFLVHQRPRTFLSSFGAGARAFGLPAAIGASIGAPNRRVLLVDGDSGIQTSIQELANVASLKLPIIMFILDNGAQAREMHDDTIPTPDFVAIARAYGIEGHRVDDARSLEDVLDERWNERTPVLIHIKVAPLRMTPRAPKGESLSAYTGNCVAAPGKLFSRDELLLLEQVATGSFDDEP